MVVVDLDDGPARVPFCVPCLRDRTHRNQYLGTTLGPYASMRCVRVIYYGTTWSVADKRLGREIDCRKSHGVASNGGTHCKQGSKYEEVLHDIDAFAHALATLEYQLADTLQPCHVE